LLCAVAAALIVHVVLNVVVAAADVFVGDVIAVLFGME
jgi:hypothetical protein